MRICLACSAGGHLAELLRLSPAFSSHRRFFLTTRRQDTEDLSKREDVHFVTDPGRSPLRLLRNIFQTLAIILREQPDLVLTTGAGIAVPACYIAKLLGRRVIFIESVCRVAAPSLSGRLAYPAADLFLVQWRSLLRRYGRKAKCWGSVI